MSSGYDNNDLIKAVLDTLADVVDALIDESRRYRAAFAGVQNNF